MTSTSTNLLSRLSSATSPNRELDTEIALANEWTCDGDPNSEYTQWYKPGDADDRFAPAHYLPSYTESIDAALTLMPEDPANRGKPMLWSISYDEDGVAGVRGYGASLSKGYHDPQTIYGYSEVSPAIALLIAIEKVKEDRKP